MEYTQGYGSLIIRFDEYGNSYLTPAKGKDIIKEVLPDAAEFVTLYCKDAMLLKGVMGFNMIIAPNVSLRTLISEFQKKCAIVHSGKDVLITAIQMLA